MGNKCKIFKKGKRQSGITLVALVVTIVVLLILAGISINLILGNNGIINRTQDAKDKYEQAKLNEQKDMDEINNWMDDASDALSKVKIYAKLYSYNDGSGSLLEISSDPEYVTSETNVTLTKDYGNIGNKKYKYVYEEKEIEDETGNIVYVHSEEGSALPPWLELISEQKEGYVSEYYNDNLNIINVKITENIKPADTACWFYGLKNLKNIENIERIDTSSVTDMSYMFCYCQNLTSLDVSEFDTSNVTNMRTMFCYCQNLMSLDVSGFDTSNVTNMKSMFGYCKNLTSLAVGGFDTSNVTDMSYMFCYCQKLTSLDVSGVDTGNVTNMRAMFYYCQNLTSIAVSGFDTSRVTNMSAMFRDCNSLTSLDVSGFDTSSVTDMSIMFYNCKNLTSLDVSGFATSNVTDMSFMFYYCQKLTSLDVSRV